MSYDFDYYSNGYEEGYIDGSSGKTSRILVYDLQTFILDFPPAEDQTKWEYEYSMGYAKGKAEFESSQE